MWNKCINESKSFIKVVVAVAFMGVSVASCVDMDLSPNGAPSDTTVWDSPSLAEQTVAGVYNQLYEDFNSIDDGWFDSWSSLMDNSAGRAPSFHFLFANNSSSSNMGSAAVWQRYYKGILKANDVIGHLPTVEGFNEKKRTVMFQNVPFYGVGGTTD